jgi:pSer/pThr/pTyr-binding forkhead associated (FHA) protein
MRVVIEIARGPQAGQRKLLTPGNQIIVGRSEFADMSCSSDSQMSREHFRLSADDDDCILEDLKSRNGTLVNEVPVDRPVRLEDGDKITTGSTVFLVLLQGGRSADFAATQSGVRREGFDPKKSSVVVDALKGRLSGTYATQKCHSGLFQYVGDCEKLPATDIAELLSRRHEAYLILDKNRSGIELPPMATEPAVLFDFLPPEAAAAMSPVLIAGADCREWTNLITEAWGSDSLVIFYSDAEKAEVLNAVRTAVKADKNGGIVGICWPGVLDSLLTFDKSGTASRLVNLAETIMIEAADLPEQWHVYSKNDLRSTLNRFGLKEAAAPATVEGSSVPATPKEK